MNTLSTISKNSTNVTNSTNGTSATCSTNAKSNSNSTNRTLSTISTTDTSSLNGSNNFRNSASVFGNISSENGCRKQYSNGIGIKHVTLNSNETDSLRNIESNGNGFSGTGRNEVLTKVSNGNSSGKPPAYSLAPSTRGKGRDTCPLPTGAGRDPCRLPVRETRDACTLPVREGRESRLDGLLWSRLRSRKVGKV